MCQGFFLIVTRAKSEFFLLRCSRLRCQADNEDSRHTREKTSGTLGTRMTMCFGGREKPQPELEKRREEKTNLETDL